MNSAEYWIEKLNLTPHPEGGYYKRTYQSAFEIDLNLCEVQKSHKRACSTLIYYLLKSDDVSQFHRLKSDEIWLYHCGDALTVHSILPNGNKVSKQLGLEVDKGQYPQVLISANNWFAAEVNASIGYTLVSCVVSPGFDFDDFELANKDKMLAEFPHLSDLINRFVL